MATALYRRYRPESFAEVIGQDHVTTPLMRALRAGRVGHAYLFSGPRGCGKTTSARILARCLNCAEGPTDTPCGSCDSCRDLARGGPGSLDVVEIDAASHGGVDDARELRERATFAPARDRFKVFIIDEAHMVTSAGFNALLKLVEEPPEHVKFVFATTEPDKVIGTIRSRTHHYPFRLIPPQVLTPYLQEVCEAESVPVGDGVLPLVVRAGGGSARDTLSVLDQLMAGAAEEGLDQATAIALLGFTDTALLDGAVEAIAAGDAGALYQVTEQVLATGHEPRRFVEDLLERVRDLIVLAAVPDRAQDLLPQIPADDLERMRHQAGLFTPADLSRCGDLVHETLSTMSGATSPRLHLELLAARLVLRGQAPAPVAGVPAGTSSGSPQRGPAGGGAPQGAAPAQGADGSGREMARRIAAERAEAARRARGGPGTETPRRPETEQQDRSTVSAEQPGAAQRSADPSPEDRSRVEGADASAPQSTGDDRRQAARSSWGDAAPSWGGSSGAVPSSAPGAQGAPAASADAEASTGRAGDESDPAAGRTPAGPEAAVQEQPDAADGGAPSHDAAAAAGGLDVEEVRGHWSAILDQLHEIRRAAHALVSQNAQVNEVRGTTIVLGFRSDGLVNAFRRGPMAQNVADAARRVLRTEVTVEAVVGDGPAPGAGGPGGQSGPPGGGAGGSGGSRGPGGSGGRGPSSQGGSPHGGSAQNGARWGDQIPSDQRGPSRAGQEGQQPRHESSGDGARSARQQGAESAGATGALGLAERMERNAARARGSRPQQASQDYAPEPDDPYGEPYDDGPPPGEDFFSATPQRPTAGQGRVPAKEQKGDAAGSARPVVSARSGGADADEPAPAEQADAVDDSGSDAVGGAPLEVEDEGRDTLPAGEPRTFGQAALRRALAEGRVVHSLPAKNPGGQASGGDDGENRAEAGSDPAPSAGAASSAPEVTEPSSGIPGWDRPMERPGQGAQAQDGAAPQARSSAPSEADTAASQPVRRSGADLVREAAHASMAAHRRRGNQRGPAQPEPPVDDDPTGGASRDDEDAEYTTRTGREVIEAVLGGRVLEVIDETGR